MDFDPWPFSISKAPSAPKNENEAPLRLHHRPEHGCQQPGRGWVSRWVRAGVSPNIAPLPAELEDSLVKQLL